MKTVTIPVKGLNFAGCAREIEKRLDRVEGITRAEASYVTQTATVTFQENKVSEARLREMLKDCGFACGEPVSLPGSATMHDHVAPQQHRRDGNGTMAIKPEEEPPAGIKIRDGHETHEAHPHQPAMSVAAPTREETDHKEMSHDMMGHDMSDPAMARAMEADMRNRFFVSFVLTIPVVLYSPLGVNLFGLRLPTPFGINPNWVLLVLSTPVVWWGGWIFHSGAWRALRNRALNMNVLVSLGVLVAYLFSVFATLFAPQVETSYDAAAMLVTFVLFGHWMEMRSRRGSSDALNALLRLAPSQANLVGPDGEVRTVPVEEVKIGDLLLIRPGAGGRACN